MNTEQLVEVAASLNDQHSIENNKEYLRGQAELIAYAAGLGGDATDLLIERIAQTATETHTVRITYTITVDFDADAPQGEWTEVSQNMKEAALLHPLVAFVESDHGKMTQ